MWQSHSLLSELVLFSSCSYIVFCNTQWTGRCKSANLGNVHTQQETLKMKSKSMITNRVRSTTERLCFDTCLSICLSTLGRGTPAGGWYPCQLGYPTSGTPLLDLGGVPCWGGYPTSGTPCQTWAGGYPILGTPIRPW